MYYANIELCSSDFKIIEALFALNKNVRDIAAIVGVSDKTVTAYVEDHKLVRKRTCDKNNKKTPTLKDLVKEQIKKGKLSPSEKTEMEMKKSKRMAKEREKKK